MTVIEPNTDVTYHTYVAGQNVNPVSTKAFIELLKACSLGVRRPLNEPECIHGMLHGSNLVVSAWHVDDNGDSKLIGIARALSDFHYACYLADLAVDDAFQRKGIGKQLINMVITAIQPSCKIILMAAPAANDYYAPLGFEHNPRCWVLPERNA